MPPVHSRFEKGKSGNPSGRPRKRVISPPYEAALGQMVTITDENGVKRTVTAEDAFIQRHLKLGAKGNISSNQKTMKLLKDLSEIYKYEIEDSTEYLSMNYFLFSVNDAMLPLGMAQKLYRSSISPLILIEPWLVQAALSRLGDRTLSIAEQQEVWGATRTPNKVVWPSWWTERRGTGVKRWQGPLIDANGFQPPDVVPKLANQQSRRGLAAKR